MQIIALKDDLQVLFIRITISNQVEFFSVTINNKKVSCMNSSTNICNFLNNIFFHFKLCWKDFQIVGLRQCGQNSQFRFNTNFIYPRYHSKWQNFRIVELYNNFSLSDLFYTNCKTYFTNRCIKLIFINAQFSDWSTSISDGMNTKDYVTSGFFYQYYLQ